MTLRFLSRTLLVGACYVGVGCGDSGADDDSTAGSGATAAMSSSGTGGASAGTGGSAAGSGGSGNSGGATTGGKTATGGAGGSASAGGKGGSESGSGGTGGSGNSSGLDPDALITSLTDPEKAQLCDWMVEPFGGYNVTTECPTGQVKSVKTFPSQESCVMFGLSFTCMTVKVSDVEACQLSKVPSGGCDRSDPSCLALDCM